MNPPQHRHLPCRNHLLTCGSPPTQPTSSNQNGSATTARSSRVACRRPSNAANLGRVGWTPARQRAHPAPQETTRSPPQERHPRMSRTPWQSSTRRWRRHDRSPKGADDRPLRAVAASDAAIEPCRVDRNRSLGGAAKHPAPTAWQRIGGLVGLIQSSVPSVVFVGADALLGLDAGLACAVAAAITLTVLRKIRRQPLGPALSSFVGVAVSSLIAYRTSAARDYFLPDIWISLSCCPALAVSILVRWPLVGVLWSGLNRAPMTWKRDRPSLLGYDLATGVLSGMFATRFVVQHWLYQREDTTAIAKIAVTIRYGLLP